MLNIAIWLVVGAAIGGAAGLLMRGDEDDAVFTNVAVGIAGALLAAWFAAPEIGLRALPPGALGLGAVAMALLGAVALLALVAVVRHRRRPG